jgi:hypothetical protein
MIIVTIKMWNNWLQKILLFTHPLFSFLCLEITQKTAAFFFSGPRGEDQIVRDNNLEEE